MLPQEETGETQILAALLGIAEMVGNLSDTDEILAAIVRIAPSLVRVDRCALMVYDEPTREFRTLLSFAARSTTRYEGFVLAEEEMPRLAPRLLKQRLPVVMKDAARDQLLPPSVIQRLGLRSLLIAPLVARGRVLGTLWLDSTTGYHYFTSKEINVVLGIATEAAVALELSQALAASTREQRRFAALAVATCDGVVITDSDFRVRHLDPAAELLLGWTTEDAQGRKVSELFDISPAEASIGWTMETSRPSPAVKDLSLRTKSGERIACRIHTAAVRDETGSIREIVYALRQDRKGERA